MIVKIHSTPNGNMLAVCDSNILGKVFEEENIQIDLSARFYQGEKLSIEKIEVLLKDCYVVNAVGKNSVDLLIRKNLVEKCNVRVISGIPYAQCTIARSS